MKAPELTGIDHWINSSPLTLASLKGRVVLIDFWTYTCINCLRTLPHMQQLHTTYADHGFVLLGIHTPEFDFEKLPDNVATAALRLGLTYPIAMDNDYTTWQAYANHYWPAHYLIDPSGTICWTHHGEGAYLQLENAIRGLLGLAQLQRQEEEPTRRPQSPETYLGTFRGERYLPELLLRSDEVVTYAYDRSLPHDTVGLRGPWRIERECITACGSSCFLDYNALASSVHLVLSGNGDGFLHTAIDGKPHGQLLVRDARMYDVASVPYGRHLLSLHVPQGVSAYAFTFGSN